MEREDIFVTTKVQPAYHNRIELSLSKSLAKFNLDYVDLLLVHFPVGLNPNGNHELLPTRPDGTRDVDHEFDIIKTWRQFEAVLASGKVKSIVVSNFQFRTLNYYWNMCMSYQWRIK
jgi:glycerol 2-dehydrogenase (NADP+)